MKRLGLVLGGGGARGLAHLGVLDVLQRAGLTPHCIVGVSMGAVVGATFAARDDWRQAFLDVDRERLPSHLDLREAEGLDLLRNMVRSAMRLAPSVWNLRRVGFEEIGRATLKDLLGAAETFADLRLPFAAVATDIAAGQRVVFRSGDLVSAVVASSALPVLTRPISLDGQLLLDGGFADPCPVDVARDMGAEVVAAVHVGRPELPGGGEPEGQLAAVIRAVEVGLQRFVSLRLAAADLVVRPSFPDGTNWLNFEHAEDLARAGAVATRGTLDDLRRLVR